MEQPKSTAHTRSLSRRTAALAMALVSVLMTRLPSRAVAAPADDWEKMFYMIADQDVVVRGTLVSVDTLMHHRDGTGCGLAITGYYPAYQVVVNIADVIAGAPESSLVTLTILDSPPADAVAGADVLAYGHRSCWDAWALVGGVAWIHTDGRLASDSGLNNPLLNSPGLNLQADAVIARLKMEAPRHMVGAVLAAQGYYLGKVSALDTSGTSVIFTCDSIGVAGVGPARFARYVVQEWDEYRAHYNPVVGDTIVIPLDPDGVDSLHVTRGCVGALRVNGGMYWPAGTSLSALAARKYGSAKGLRRTR